jgi:SAM-dependent methyltransferase
VRHGVLVCAAPDCGARFPVIDGLAVLVPDLEHYLAEAAVYLLMRDDLPGDTVDLLGAHLPPGSYYDAARQHLSSYARDHYGSFDPAETDEIGPGSSWNLVETGLTHAGSVDGPIVEFGCATGGGCFRIAERLGLPVLGIDLSAPLIRLATEIGRSGRVRYPRRSAGTAYVEHAFPLPFQRRELVDFWLADALSPPLEPGSAGLVLAINLFDCVKDPARLVATIADMLRPGGKAILATPFDWSVAATPRDRWFGGKSVLDSPPSMKEAIAAEPRLDIIACETDLPWSIRLHDRATMAYRVEMQIVRKESG